MTKEKWFQCRQKALQEFTNAQIKNSIGVSPEDWPLEKTFLMMVIKQIDEATEVYNMENSKKEKE